MIGQLSLEQLAVYPAERNRAQHEYSYRKQDMHTCTVHTQHVCMPSYILYD